MAHPWFQQDLPPHLATLNDRLLQVRRLGQLPTYNLQMPKSTGTGGGRKVSSPPHTGSGSVCRVRVLWLARHASSEPGLCGNTEVLTTTLYACGTTAHGGALCLTSSRVFTVLVTGATDMRALPPAGQEYP